MATPEKATNAPARTLEIFEHFSTVTTPLSLSEIAQLMNVPVSSCQLLLRAMVDRGYLYSFGSRKLYYPTRRIFDVASRIRTFDPLVDALRPSLKELAAKSDETVILGKRQGNRALYLEVVESRQAVRYSPNAGEYKPLHSSAIGKALLGALPMDALDKLLETLPLKRLTSNTITSAAQLKANLSEGRKRGYYLTRGENVAVDVMGISGSVMVENEVLAIAIAGPWQRLEPVLTKQAALLQAFLTRLSKGNGLYATEPSSKRRERTAPATSK